MRCQAKNPTTCRAHGIESGILTPKQLQVRAFNNSSSEIDKPLWWEQYYPKRANAKILDSFDTPVGKVVVIWEENDNAEKDPGDPAFDTTCRYRKLSNGKSVARLSMKHDHETDLRVNSSYVNDDLRGKGYGSTLYVYTAKQLATTGRRLTNGNIQSPDAVDLWNNLKKHYPDKIISTLVANRWGRTFTTYFDLTTK